MKALILKLSLIVIPLGLMIVLVNYKVDPANLFTGPDFTKGIALILNAGNNVENTKNYNERILQSERIKLLGESPTLAVLGSSRIMEIGSDFFPGKRVLNLGVSHASIYDVVAIIGLLDSCNKLPAEMIINVDPGLIGQNGTPEWKDIGEYINYLVKKFKKPYQQNQPDYSLGNFYKLKALLSIDYFRSSVDFLLERGNKHYYSVGHEIPSFGRFFDGTIKYPYTYTHPDTFRVAKDAKITAMKEGIPMPETDKILMFKGLLEYLKGKGVKVRLIMLPFHMEYYKTVNEYFDYAFVKMERVLNEIAVQEQISISGSFDPAVFKLQESDFYDMYHCSKQAIWSNWGMILK
jgi:hypothetical protein